jgi:hypothetical protein
MDDEKKNPNALTYGISPSAPASIKPVDIDKWKAVVAPTFKHYFTERYNELVKEYEKLVKDYQINQLLYESSIGFKPIIGQTYYLYKKENGSAFISMVLKKHFGMDISEHTNSMRNTRGKRFYDNRL